MKTLFVITGLVIGPCLLHGQSDWKPRDSIRMALEKRPGFRIGLDGRNSFLNGNPVRVAGARVGLDYGKVGVYTGYYNTSFTKFGEVDTMYTGFGYFSSTFEYYLYEGWRFQVVNSYQLGIGNAYDFRKNGPSINRRYQGIVVPIEIGICGTVRFLRYFGFCAGLGIRLTPLNGPGFSGAYYSYGFTMFTGTLYRDCKKGWKKVKQRD